MAGPGASGWRAYLPGAAGVAYLAAWAAGLAIWPVNLALNATATQVAASHQAHPAEAAVQYLLAEGVAGVLLGTVLAYGLLARRSRRMDVRATCAVMLGAVAVAASLTQCILGLLVTAAATGHDIASCGALFAVVNRLDGVKMLALAGVAGLTAAITNPAALLPRWLRATSVLLTAALIASGCAYVTLANPLAWTAYVSGPLLLLWVAGTGITLTARRRASQS